MKKAMTLHHSSGFDNTIEYLPEQEPSHPHFTMVCNISFACFSAAVTETKNYMILDTACRRSCCGTQWIALQAEKLEAARLKIVKQASQEQFQFGAGAPINHMRRKHGFLVLLNSVVGFWSQCGGHQNSFSCQFACFEEFMCSH